MSKSINSVYELESGDCLVFKGNIQFLTGVVEGTRCKFIKVINENIVEIEGPSLVFRIGHKFLKDYFYRNLREKAFETLGL